MAREQASIAASPDSLMHMLASSPAARAVSVPANRPPPVTSTQAQYAQNPRCMAPSRPDCCPGSGLRIARQNHAKSADHPEFGFTRAPGPIPTPATVTFLASSVTDSAVNAKKIMKTIFASPAFAVYELCSADKLRGRFACVCLGRRRAAHEANLSVRARASRTAGRDQRIGGWRRRPAVHSERGQLALA